MLTTSPILRPRLAQKLIQTTTTTTSFRKMATTTTTNTDGTPRKLRILMLHGYTQSGPLFHAKTKALEKSLAKAFPAAPAPGHLATHPGGISLHYPTAPIKLSYADIPGVNVDGAEDRRLLARAREASYSPDGTRLVFGELRGTGERPAATTPTCRTPTSPWPTPGCLARRSSPPSPPTRSRRSST